MSKGGDFGADRIRYFNGGLFADADVVDLIPAEIEALIQVNECDWGSVEPSIFGTLFERSLDPDKRGQVGTHYTSKDDVLALLGPVLMSPLRGEWEQVKGECDALWAAIRQEAKQEPGSGRRKKSKPREAFDRTMLDFAQRLSQVSIGQLARGNFLYAAIHLLLARDEGSHHLRSESRSRRLSTRHSYPIGWHREQPLRESTRSGGHLDRLPAMEVPERLRTTAEAGS